MFLWNSHVDNQQEWMLRQGLKSGMHDIQSHPLIEPNKILLAHIKLGVMKNFVKTMERESSGFAFLQKKFPQISMEKLNAGIFDDPQIRELMNNPTFNKALGKAKLSAWHSLKSIVINFQGNHLSEEYEKEIEGLLKSFCQLGAWMSVKLHFLWSCRLFSKELWRFERRAGWAL